MKWLTTSDRRELRGISDQDELRRLALDDLSHNISRYHRGLIDYDGYAVERSPSEDLTV